MVGTLTVQNLQGPASGANANKVIIPSGHTLDASAGFVPSAGQIVKRAKQYFYTSEGTTSTTFVDATGGSISFACDYADSLVQINLICMVSGKGRLRVLADATEVTSAADAYNYYNGDTAQVNWNNSSVRRMANEVHYYEPNSTSAITYKVQYRAYQATGASAFGVNEIQNNLTNKYSHIEIVEIKQ